MRMLRILGVLAVAATVLAALPTGSTHAAPATQQNLLQNPGFEGSFNQFAYFATAIMADKWLPWWKEQSGDDEAWKNRMPEYKAAAPYANRIHSGGNAQQYFSYYGTHVAGIYQQVGGIGNGARLRFTIWGQAWAGGGNDADKSEGGGPMHMKIGIDPTGGTNPWSSSIVWSGEQNPLDQWSSFSVEAVARANQVTVFTYSAPDYPTQHNDVYWDDASLSVVAPPVPPTNTPRPYVPPTSTPIPTVTETPTITPTPTNTETPTPVTTSTPTPTSTPTVTPTPVAGSICVVAYDDRDGSRVHDPGEPLLPYAVFTLSDAQHVIGTYQTNGLNEPYCFEDLGSQVYFVSEMNPPGYESTTHDSWGVSLQGGTTVNLEFGNRTELAPTPTATALPSPTPTKAALFSTVGSAVFSYSGIIIIVLAAGVLIAFNAARRG